METAFSIIIPTWNNLPFLKVCIDSIRRHSAAQHQIIIHVNEGSDGTLEWVREQGFDYTFSPKNIGVCFACNMMRTKVKKDYILYINDDMYALPGWDTALADEIASLPDNRFYLSGTMIQSKHTVEGGAQSFYGDTLENFEEERLLREFRNFQLPDWSGASHPPSLIHRDLWDLVGGFGVEFSPGMGSDPDLTAKLWMAGVRYFKGVGASRVYHFETKSTERIKQNNPRMQFLLKWGISISTLRYKIVHLGEPWNGPCQDYHLSRSTALRYRLKTIIHLLTGKPLGAVDVWESEQ